MNCWASEHPQWVLAHSKSVSSFAVSSPRAFFLWRAGGFSPLSGFVQELTSYRKPPGFTAFAGPATRAERALGRAHSSAAVLPDGCVLRGAVCPQVLRGVKKGCLLLPWCWLFAVSRGWRQTAAGLPAPVSLQQDRRPCRPPCPPPLSEPPRPCWGSLGFPGLCVSCSGLTRRSDGNGRMRCSGPTQAPWVDGTWCFVGSRFCVPKINQRQPLPHILPELCGVCDHHSGVRWRGHPCAVIGGPILSPKGDPQVPGLWGYGVQRIPH